MENQGENSNMENTKNQAEASDNLIRDIPLMQRRTRQNEPEDVRFRNRLKYQLEISNAALDTIVHEITDDVWSKIDCTECAHCCKTLQIEVSTKDIARLAAHLEISIKEFTKRYTRIGEDNAKVLKTIPCAFLGKDNLCTVYEARPDSCRDYPLLHKPNFRSRSLFMLESNAVCPIVFNVWQRLKARYGKRSGRG